MIRKLGVTVLGVALVVVACGDDEPAAKYPTPDSFCTGKAEEECKVVAATCAVSAEQCKTARKNACSVANGAAITGGRTYQAQNAEACITKTKEVYADRVIVAEKEVAYNEACGRVFKGAKKKNESCASEFDCEGALVCDLDKKLCAEKNDQNLDDPCNNPGDICAKGLYCTLRGSAKFCVAKNKIGDTCNEDAPCVDEARCLSGTCVARVGSGQPCDRNDDCVTSFCNPDTKKCQGRQYVSENGTCKDFGGT